MPRQEVGVLQNLETFQLGRRARYLHVHIGVENHQEGVRRMRRQQRTDLVLGLQLAGPTRAQPFHVGALARQNHQGVVRDVLQHADAVPRQFLPNIRPGIGREFEKIVSSTEQMASRRSPLAHPLRGIDSPCFQSYGTLRPCEVPQ